MKYVLVNLECEASSALESLLDDQVLKEFAYSSKYKTPKLAYNNILLPVKNVDKTDQAFLLNEQKVKQHIVYHQGIDYSEDIIYSLFLVFSLILEKSKSLSLDIGQELSDEQIGISYTDGSFSKNQTSAAYACCKLLNESPDGLLDDFTGKKFIFDAFSGTIKEGTNNIGELTAIKIAIENFNNKTFQLIISDSIYGIKSYREYIHVWKNNGYKTYGKKEIKNKDLIIETYEELKEVQKNKIVLLKWTKGHDQNSFNEKCDELAKKELGI